MTPPRAIIDRWRCLRPWERETPSAFAGVSVEVLFCMGAARPMRERAKNAHSVVSLSAQKERLTTMRTLTAR
ncbi:hypothetical protein GCM10010321_29950 [Streptomyces chartreusis]|nr:hypothetical protein GCM10010321_29950 [Streptomyces chartreusis]